MSDESLLQEVLQPYRPNCRYLLRAERVPSAAPLVAVRGEFSIPESCYIADTGHFNAVEFNICYNQLAYFLMATCVHHRLAPLASWSMEEYRRRQLSDFLIVQFSSTFRRQMAAQHFTGVVELREVRPRSKALFIQTYCRFEDGKGGLSEGEPVLAILGEGRREP